MECDMPSLAGTYPLVTEQSAMDNCHLLTVISIAMQNYWRLYNQINPMYFCVPVYDFMYVLKNVCVCAPNMSFKPPNKNNFGPEAMMALARHGLTAQCGPASHGDQHVAGHIGQNKGITKLGGQHVVDGLTSFIHLDISGPPLLHTQNHN